VKSRTNEKIPFLYAFSSAYKPATAASNHFILLSVVAMPPQNGKLFFTFLWQLVVVVEEEEPVQNIFCVEIYICSCRKAERESEGNEKRDARWRS